MRPAKEYIDMITEYMGDNHNVEVCQIKIETISMLKPKKTSWFSAYFGYEQTLIPLRTNFIVIDGKEFDVTAETIMLGEFHRDGELRVQYEEEKWLDYGSVSGSLSAAIAEKAEQILESVDIYDKI
jgi:hypothetical protein